MANNPFETQVLNPFQALLYGQQSYDSGVKRSQENATKSALQQLMSGGAAGPDGQADWQGAARSLAASNNLDGATKIAQLAKTFQPETSADLQAYNYAVKNNGYKGTLLEFKKDIAQAGATRVNTNVNTGEKEYDKALNKDLADVFLGYQKAGRNAAGALNTLDLMENLTKDPNFYSGTGGDLVTRAKQAGASLGLVVKDAATANEVFKSLGNKLVIDAAGGSLGAQISNADVSFIRDTVPNIANTPDGNRQMIGVQRKLYQRQQQVAKMARDYAARNGGRLDYRFDEQLADYAEKNPLFPTSKSSAQPRSEQSGPIDVQGSLNAARDAIAKNPAIRGAVIKRLQENGIDPGGL